MPSEDAGLWASTLIHSRHTTLPKRLHAPGPGATQRALILEAAAAAPDHGQLQPWRFVEIPTDQRDRLAEAFVQALLERDPDALPDDIERAREKAHRAPWLMLLVVRLRGLDPEIDASERLLSAGCAVQNMLLTATALGYGSALTSGKAIRSAPLRALFGLAPDEDALCFISLGSARDHKPPRPRPAVSAYFNVLGARPPRP
jgi:nitroreductase